MKKKALLFVFASVIATVIASPVGATELSISDVTKASMNTTQYTDQYGDNVLQQVYYNKQGSIVEVSVEKGQLAYSTDSTLASKTYFARSRSTVTSRLEPSFGIYMRIYANGFSDSYTNTSRSSKKSIDKISVNTTLIMNGSVENQASDARSSSSFANATAKQQRYMVATAPQYSRSSHVYENRGASKVNHNTSAKR
uniref:hypothetical protein n=1 Tax=Planococcus citreus TaxID=1373 RepID=UPI0015CFBE7D|nr:hypothetical protein [Planococcus citreus]